MQKTVSFFGLPAYRAVWRWHFYAGLYCIPFVLFLAASGTLYLFQPQIEAYIDRPYDDLAIQTSPKSPAQIVEAAETAFPGASFRFYEIAPTDDSAARVVLLYDQSRLRTYLHPGTLQVMHSVREEDRFMRVVRRLHGELWMGENGSYLVELAACWTVILVLTGLYLWWPRNVKGFGGVLYPRLALGSKTFWRDLHAVTGIWVSLLVLILVLTGLPWAKFWGGYFKDLRKATHTSATKQSWSTRSAFRDEPPAEGYDVRELDRVVETAMTLNIPAPVQVSPPAGKTKAWTVQSMTPNRPQRVTFAVDGKSGRVLSRHGFEDQHVIDKMVGTGIAFHEGQLFGWPNQLLGVMTTTGLMLMSISGVILWWRRRQQNTLGAPEPTAVRSVSVVLVGFIVLLGIALPLFGLSLIVVLLLERLLLSRWNRLRLWLGLSSALLLVTVGGCGSDRVDGGTEATITVAGEPVVDVQVRVFSMKDGKPVELGFAVSKAGGKLSFVKPKASGPLTLEPGEYRFTVEPVGAPLALPKDYGNAETTPLQIELPTAEPITLTLPEPTQKRW